MQVVLSMVWTRKVDRNTKIKKCSAVAVFNVISKSQYQDFWWVCIWQTGSVGYTVMHCVDLIAHVSWFGTAPRCPAGPQDSVGGCGCLDTFTQSTSILGWVYRSQRGEINQKAASNRVADSTEVLFCITFIAESLFLSLFLCTWTWCCSEVFVLAGGLVDSGLSDSGDRGANVFAVSIL